MKLSLTNQRRALTGVLAGAIALFILIPFGDAQSNPGLSFRLAYEKETPGSFKMQLRTSDEVLNVSSTIVLDEKDVLSARVEPGLLYRQILITLTPDGGKRLRAVTASNLGTRLGIVVEGKLVAAPIIRQAIDGDQLSINTDPSEIDLLAKRINDAVKKR
jgi:preprotein translocase subunit SecD